MRLVQFLTPNGGRAMAAVMEGGSRLQMVEDTPRVYDLALEAGRNNSSLEALVASRLGNRWVDYDEIVQQKRLLPPIDHPDPAHCFVTGTGLTHLGSAQARDAMHTEAVPEKPVPEIGGTHPGIATEQVHGPFILADPGADARVAVPVCRAGHTTVEDRPKRVDSDLLECLACSPGIEEKLHAIVAPNTSIRSLYKSLHRPDVRF